MAYHVSGELKMYTDIPQFDSYSEKDLDHLSVDKQKELLHGYYAAASYMDAQLVKVLNELDRLGLTNNTIVVLWVGNKPDAYVDDDIKLVRIIAPVGFRDITLSCPIMTYLR